MAWYQYKDQIPTNGLPERIRLDDGSVMRNLHELSSERLIELDVKEIPDPPNYKEYEEIVWDNYDKKWNVTLTTDKNKFLDRWRAIDYYKVQIMSRMVRKLSELHLQNINLTEEFVKVIDILDRINEKNYDNPFQFDFTVPQSLGITSELGIPDKELSIIYEVFAEFANECIVTPSYDYLSACARASIKKYWKIDCPQGNLDLVPDHIKEPD